MNVRDDRDGAGVMNGAQGPGCRLVGYGDAHDFAARVVQAFDLAEGGLHVPRVGIRHALDDNGCTSADTDGAEFQLSSLFAGADGERDAAKIVGEMKKLISAEPLATIDYVEMVNMDTMQSIEKAEGHVLCAMAVKFGKARLIDNFIAEL